MTTDVNRRWTGRIASLAFWLALWMLPGGDCRAEDRAALRLAADGRTLCAIVVPEQASEMELTAATELADYLEKVTGARPGVSDQPDGLKSNIYVGYFPRWVEALADVDWPALGTDGIVIRTVGTDLVLSGGRPRGSLYAVYTFLQDVVGVRWWAPDAEFVPSRPTLAVDALNVAYTPPLEVRFVGSEVCTRKPHTQRLRLTVKQNFDPTTHSIALTQLPMRKYFAEHPEWYAFYKNEGSEDVEYTYLYMVKLLKDMGLDEIHEVAKRTRRIPPQPCLHSEGALRTVMQSVMAELERDYASWEYGPKIVWITQADGGYMCECDECERVRREEGSDSANWLQFVNTVAEEVETKYQDVMVGMFAYLQTEAPPKTLKPRKNVLIYSALLARNFLDGVSAYPFHADSLKTWTAMSARVYVWDYDPNFRNYYYPHPNYFMNGDNCRYFAEIGVDGLFIQSSWGGAADFAAMRAWVASQMMWNPDQDQRALVSEFLDGYYGAAGTHLLEYLDLLVAAAHRKPDFWLSCYATTTDGWLTLADLNGATRLMDSAAESVAHDPVVSQRVWLARRAIDFVWLDRYDELKKQAEAEGSPFLGPAEPAKLVDTLAAYEQAWGHYREGGDFSEYFQRLRAKYPAE